MKRNRIALTAVALIIVALLVALVASEANAQSRWDRINGRGGDSTSSSAGRSSSNATATPSARSTDTPAQQRRNSATAVPRPAPTTPAWNGDGNEIRRWHRSWERRQR